MKMELSFKSVERMLLRFFMLLISVLFFECSVYAVPDNPIFRHLDTRNGLANNSVSCIEEDDFGFMWFGTKNGVCRYDGQGFKLFGNNEMIASICNDKHGRIWYSSFSGLYCVDLASNTIKDFQNLIPGHYSASFVLVSDYEGGIWMIVNRTLTRLDFQKGIACSYALGSHASPNRICCGTDGWPYVTADDGCVYIYDREEDIFLPLRILAEEEIKAGKELEYLAFSPEGFAISTTDNDVILYNSENGTSKLVFGGNEDGRDAQVRCVEIDADGCILVGTDKGLYSFFPDGKKQLTVHDSIDFYSLSNDNVRCMKIDSRNHLWLGTFYSGVNIRERPNIRFYRNLADTANCSISGNTVRAIASDPFGNIWAGTEDGFLNVINADGTVFCFGYEQSVPKSNFHSIALKDGKMYVASYDNGIFVFDALTRKLERHIKPESAHSVVIYCLRDGTIALGTTIGLFYLNQGKNELEYVEGTESLFVHSMCQVSSDILLLGTYSKGVFMLDLNDGSINPLNIDVGDAPYPSFVTHIFQDSNRKVWLSTEGSGLFRIDAKVGKGKCSATHFSESDGLPSNIIGAVCQSFDGRIWVSTDLGLISISEQDKVDRLIDKDIPIGLSFRYGSVLHAADDSIYMGATDGMLSFKPSDFKMANPYPVFCTDVIAGGQNGEMSILKENESTLTGKKFKVKQKDASYLTFHFACPSSDSYSKTVFKYSLQKGKNRFESFTEDGHITFAGISAGKYKFEVGVKEPQSENASIQYEIVVVPPFLISVPAIVLYISLLVLILCFGIYRWVVRKREERSRMLKSIDEEKQKEIYQAKINFFTNIAHDIRTPLSLIKMPVDKIISGKEYTEKTEEDMRLIKANTDRLLDLTNQLVDFRKIESKQMRLNFINEDICALVSKCCDCFKPAAEIRDVTFRTEIPEHKIMVMCAAESVEKIVSNMLSNAFKYCDSEVIICLELSKDGNNVCIRVSSDGAKIAKEDRSRIFEPFFQEKNRKTRINGSKGSGLGLPFSRSLAELHNGSLVLDVSDSEMNSFILTLPRVQEGQIGLSSGTTDDLYTESNYDLCADRHNLLVAEDNQEMASYLKRELSRDYNVFCAQDGEDALNVLHDNRIDLLISDIMMPRMSGCELCNYIKTHLEYSHIPVILLTAGVGMETHLKSLKVGADGYLEKPFGIELLRANISNIFKNRELSYKQYSSSPLSNFTVLKVSNRDEVFMENLNSEIMSRISDSELGVEDLGSALGMSKSTLFRKVKANTNLNINEYIRLVRLKRAAELLSEGKYRINEVAYLVGFSSPSYFASKFQKQFNLSPSEFAKKVKE